MAWSWESLGGWSGVSLGVAAFSLSMLAGGVVAVLFDRLHVSLTCFHRLRTVGGGLVTGYAALSVVRFLENMPSESKAWPSDGFAQELAGYLIFWFLFPPVWFFVERFSIEQGAVTGHATTSCALTRLKDFGDLAAKVWAAIVALLLVLITLAKP